MFFLTGVAAGQNVYGCTATNIWTVISGGGATSAVNDTNVSASITGGVLTMGWIGTLAKARIIGTAVYNDQANLYGAFSQDFTSATLKVPNSAGLAPTVSATIGYDTTANLFKAGFNGTSKTLAAFTGAFANNDCLKYDTTTNTIITTGSACGSGGGSSTNWVLTRTSNTVYTIAPPASGYVVEVCGNKSVRMTATATITLNASSGAAFSTAWAYYDCTTSTLKVDTNSNMTQANITLANMAFGSATATGFPNGSNRIVALTAGNTAVNQWDASPTTDWQSNQGTVIISAGADVTRTLNADGSTTLAVDTTVVPQKWFGTAPPGSVAGNLPGDLFSDTTNKNEYWCAAPSGTAAPACTTVSAGGWTQLNGGSSTVTDTISFIFGRDMGGAAGSSHIGPGIAGSDSLFISTLNNTIAYVAFPQVGDKFIVLHYHLPATWTGAIDASVPWFETGGGSGNVPITFSTACVASGGNLSTFTYNAGQIVTVAAAAANLLTYTTQNTLTTTGCSAGNEFFLKVERAGGGSDTYTGDMEVMGVILTVRHT